MFEGAETSCPEPMPPRGMIGATLNTTPTMTQKLYEEKARLSSRLDEINMALSAIESNPQVQQVIDALAKLHWLR